LPQGGQGEAQGAGGGAGHPGGRRARGRKSEMIATASEPEAQASVEPHEVQVGVVPRRAVLGRAVVDPLVAHGGEQVRVLRGSDVQSCEGVRSKVDPAAAPEVEAMGSCARTKEWLEPVRAEAPQ